MEVSHQIPWNCAPSGSLKGLKRDLLQRMVLHSPNPCFHLGSVAGALASEGNRLDISQWVLSHCTVHHLFLLSFTPLSLSFITIIVVIIIVVVLNIKLFLYQLFYFFLLILFPISLGRRDVRKQLHDT